MDQMIFIAMPLGFPILEYPAARTEVIGLPPSPTPFTAVETRPVLGANASPVANVLLEPAVCLRIIFSVL